NVSKRAKPPKHPPGGRARRTARSQRLADLRFAARTASEHPERLVHRLVAIETRKRGRESFPPHRASASGAEWNRLPTPFPPDQKRSIFRRSGSSIASSSGTRSKSSQRRSLVEATPRTLSAKSSGFDDCANASS